jgi:type VI secretion system secreted protein Hcp
MEGGVMSLFTCSSNPHRGRAILLGAIAALAILAGVALAVSVGAQPTAAQSDEVEVPWINGYVQFADIVGESTDADHSGWCEFLTFDQALLAPAGRAGGGAAATKVEFEDILLVKPLDVASPLLQQAVAKGTVLPTVKIELTAGSGGVARLFYSYELTNAQITHYNVGTTGQRDLTPKGLPRIELSGPTLADGLPVEELSISFSRIKVKYVQLGPEGQQISLVEFSWDVARNRP